MARLTPEQWEQARAEYEVRGVSLGVIAEHFGVSDVAVGKRARKEGWTKGKSSDIVEKKVNAIKLLYDIERQSSDLPQTFRTTIDDVVRERLEADHLLAQLDKALMLKAHAILAKVELPEDWEIMTRGRRNLAPAQAHSTQTTVNVQQQAQAGISVQSPRDALVEIVRQAEETEGCE